MMTLRYCPRCRADVEDAGGFCLLGHRLPPTDDDPIADLRTEVDRAFEKVQLDVSSIFDDQLESAPVPAPVSESHAQVDPVPDLVADSPLSEHAAPSVYEQLKSDEEALDEIMESRRDVWRALTDEGPVERDDPILAFSPSPRMEWGPGKSKRRRPKRD